jgi:hypothetical protein
MKAKNLILNTFGTAMIFVFTAGTLFAQPYESIEDIDILEQQKDVLRQKYEHEFNEIDVLGGYQLDETHTMVAYMKNGIYHEAIMNSDRKEMMLVAIEAEVPVEDVPDVVINALENDNYDIDEVVKTFRVSTPYGENFYSVDMTEEDPGDRIYFNDLGVIQKAPY